MNGTPRCSITDFDHGLPLLMRNLWLEYRFPPRRSYRMPPHRFYLCDCKTDAPGCVLPLSISAVSLLTCNSVRSCTSCNSEWYLFSMREEYMEEILMEFAACLKTTIRLALSMACLSYESLKHMQNNSSLFEYLMFSSWRAYNSNILTAPN